MANLITTVSMLITKYWKSGLVPSKNEWLTKTRYVFLMSKLKASHKYNLGWLQAWQKYCECWLPYVQRYNAQTIKNVLAQISEIL